MTWLTGQLLLTINLKYFVTRNMLNHKFEKYTDYLNKNKNGFIGNIIAQGKIVNVILYVKVYTALP